MVKPYDDLKVNDSFFQRVFESTTQEFELVWHRDRRPREVKVISGKGWKFQFDGQIPFELEEEEIIYVPKMFYHRLIKDDEGTDLVLQIKEL